MDALLGTNFDREVADELGLTVAAVAVRRRLLRIRCYRKQPTPQRFFWTPQMRRQLGKRDDKELAKALGLTVVAIARKRGQLGIPKKEKKRRERRR